MIALKFIFVLLAATARATPVATAPGASTTDWTALALAIPDDEINWDLFDKDAFNNPANWNNTITTTTLDVRDGGLVIRSGACDQGTCPDYFAAFDLVYTFTAITSGDPPTTIFSSNSDIRVNDCNSCLRHTVGSSLGNSVPGGCYDFTGCGRAQSICVDPGNYRAHRIWKDNGVKTCYSMIVERLGDCGIIQTRIVLHPGGTVACTW